MKNMIRNSEERESPLVSVIISTYNRARYLRQCVESALSQNYPRLEVIVVDNNSSDDTPDVLAAFGDRIIPLKETRQGISAARNKGLASARGEFVAFLDSDDFYLPGKISRSVRKLLREPETAIVYTDYIRIDTGRQKTEKIHLPFPDPEEFARHLMVRGFIIGTNVVARKACLEKTGGFNEEFLFNNDIEMCLRLLKAGYRFGHVPAPLFAYRWHDDNISHDRKLARLYADRSRSRAMAEFTTQQLFGDLVSRNDWKGVKRGYEKLARKFYKRGLLDAAEAALEKAAATRGLSLRQLLTLPYLRLKIGLRKKTAADSPAFT